MDKEIGSIIKYAINNFREGDSLKFNTLFKTKTVKDKIDHDINYQIFDAFMLSKDITDPYS